MQNKVDLIEHCVSSNTLVEGGILTVKRDQVRLPNGNLSQREYVVHPGAVVIVAILANGNVVLERQFRYPLHQVFIELPAGKMDANEAVLAAGQRELTEETGYVARSWVNLGYHHPCIGYSNEVIHMYLATGLIAGEHKRDEDETLEVFDVPFARCIEMVECGEITDSKTITALFIAEKYLVKHHVDI